ncbi:MAG: anhydro-N-acetylmuramic acid kinase [Alphaproteobacteria bacterium]
MSDLRLAAGLMSGTSMDGIDAALIETDGASRVRPVAAVTVPYDPAFRSRLRGVLGERGPLAEVERELTDLHAGAIRHLLAGAGVAAADVYVAGFHGHTVLHDPARLRTRQIGDGARLAAAVGIDVVGDFRSADVAAGGQGAPLAPGYHAALAVGLERPLAVLNLGGVGNVTWIGEGEDRLLAFDTGPGNALIDDWVAAHGDLAYDAGGALAARGRVDEDVLARLMANPYFARRPPKSLDRDDFSAAPCAGLSHEDGAATLAAFTVAAVAAGLAHLPERPRRWLVTGGGRHNGTLLAGLARALGVPVEPVEAVGWDGDALEAQAFAWLAVRAVDGRPLSWPGTTGVPAPVTGGRLFRAPG